MGKCERGGNIPRYLRQTKGIFRRTIWWEYHNTCHEENLFPLFDKKQRERERERESAEKVWVGGLYQKTEFGKRPTIIIATLSHPFLSLSSFVFLREFDAHLHTRDFLYFGFLFSSSFLSFKKMYYGFLL